MRLSSKEQTAITHSFAAIIQEPFELYLFGSRTNDKKKGGDIDLLLIVSHEFKSAAIELKTKIRSRIFQTLPEQKIDITVATRKELQQNDFLKLIFPEALLLLKH